MIYRERVSSPVKLLAGYRLKAIREILRAETEAETMALTDGESHDLRAYHRALCTIGRVVLGFRGRQIVKSRKLEAGVAKVVLARHSWFVCKVALARRAWFLLR